MRVCSPIVMAVLLAGVADAEKPFVPTFESRTDLTPAGKIDELVFGKWKQLERYSPPVAAISVCRL